MIQILLRGKPPFSFLIRQACPPMLEIQLSAKSSPELSAISRQFLAES
jgi:hypothetical protein